MARHSAAQRAAPALVLLGRWGDHHHARLVDEKPAGGVVADVQRFGDLLDGDGVVGFLHGLENGEALVEHGGPSQLPNFFALQFS